MIGTGSKLDMQRLVQRNELRCCECDYDYCNWYYCFDAVVFELFEV